jgi:hypothetical protein
MAAVPAGAGFSDVRIDVQHGRILVHEHVLRTCSAQVLALRVGHHELLRSYIAGRAHEVFDARASASLQAWVQRVEQLALALEDCNAASAAMLDRIGPAGLV